MGGGRKGRKEEKGGPGTEGGRRKTQSAKVPLGMQGRAVGGKGVKKPLLIATGVAFLC